MVDISQMAEAPKPMPLGVADTARSGIASYERTRNTAAG
jgi:hypothetical protein